VVILCAGRAVADGAPAEVFTDRLLSDVYKQPVEVFPHPRTGAVMVAPVRGS
jgi:iron complex transport system ATP-binding protein